MTDQAILDGRGNEIGPNENIGPADIEQFVTHVLPGPAAPKNIQRPHREQTRPYCEVCPPTPNTPIPPQSSRVSSFVSSRQARIRPDDSQSGKAVLPSPSMIMCPLFLLLIASTIGFNVPTPHKTTLTQKTTRAPPPTDVRPAAASINTFLDNKEALAMAPVKPSQVSQNPILLAMRDDIFASAFACACIIFFPAPANAVSVSVASTALASMKPPVEAWVKYLAVADDILSATDMLLIVLGGLVVTLYLSGVVAAMVAPALSSATVTRPDYQFKEWLKYTDELPTINDLTGACVLIASGPHGHWAMCSTPKDPTCKADEEFSQYYGQPIYVCAM